MSTISLAFWADPGLTAQTSALGAIQAADASLPAVDRVVYLGSPASDRRFVAASAPQVDPIRVGVADASVGSGLATAAVRLAASAAGLATAIPGAPLDLAPTLYSGEANAVAIHVRLEAPVLADGRYADLSLVTNTLIEAAA